MHGQQSFIGEDWGGRGGGGVEGFILCTWFQIEGNNRFSMTFTILEKGKVKKENNTRNTWCFMHFSKIPLINIANINYAVTMPVLAVANELYERSLSLCL